MIDTRFHTSVIIGQYLKKYVFIHSGPDFIHSLILTNIRYFITQTVITTFERVLALVEH